MDAVEEVPLVVRLVEEESVAFCRGLGDGFLLDVREGLVAVDMWLASSQQIQIGAVEKEDLLGCHYELLGEDWVL